MNTIIFIILIGLNYLLLYLLMPNIPVGLVMCFLLIIPAFINLYFYFRDKKKVNIFIYPLITSIFSYICCNCLKMYGKLDQFASLATQKTNDYAISINTDIKGAEIIILTFLMQIIIVFIEDLILRRRENDKSIGIK